MLLSYEVFELYSIFFFGTLPSQKIECGIGPVECNIASFDVSDDEVFVALALCSKIDLYSLNQSFKNNEDKLSLSGHFSQGKKVLFTLNGRYLISFGENDQIVIVWHTFCASGTLHPNDTGLFQALIGNVQFVISMQWEMCSLFCFKANEIRRRKTQIYDIFSKSCVQSFDFNLNGPTCIRIASYSLIYIVAGDQVGTLEIAHIDSGNGQVTTSRIEAHRSAVKAISPTMESFVILSGSDDQTIKQWNVRTLTQIKVAQTEGSVMHLD
ncbi:hypothetical protein ACOME3_001526 [Neoechinorhynchus agilis]